MHVDFSAGTALVSALILVTAFFLRGMSGFGSGLLAVPLLALYLPLTFVVPLMLVVDFTAAVTLGGSARSRIAWKEIASLLPFTASGLILGLFLLIRLPPAPLELVLGVFVIAFGLRNILGLHGSTPVSRMWAAPAGLLGGTIGSMFGTGGPPYVVYLSHRIHDKTKLRATLSGLFVLDGGMRIISFLITGLLLQKRVWFAAIGALPLMGLGLYAGHRAHLRMSHAQLLRLIGALLLISGTSLLWKALR